MSSLDALLKGQSIRIVDESSVDMDESPIRTHTVAWESDDDPTNPLVGITTTTYHTGSATVMSQQPRILSETTITARTWEDLV